MTPPHPMRHLIFGILIAVNAIPSSAEGLKDLENFLATTHSGSASFTQTVTAPARTGEAAPRPKTSSGTFAFLRPDRFRFDYKKPFEQTIVADGKTLWLHDADLNQVTSRSHAQALGSAPAALVASSASLAKLGEVFEFKSEPDAEGLSWVRASPKQRDGQLKTVRVGFAQGQLAVLDMEDSFGQRSTLRFEGFKTQTAFPAAHFQFKVPGGASVLTP
jgi:outer membrane lipoprotein carrier protein